MPEPMPVPTQLPLQALQEYWIDAWQRSILTLDVLRQRGNIMPGAQCARIAPQRAQLRVRARSSTAAPCRGR